MYLVANVFLNTTQVAEVFNGEQVPVVQEHLARTQVKSQEQVPTLRPMAVRFAAKLLGRAQPCQWAKPNRLFGHKLIWHMHIPVQWLQLSSDGVRLACAVCLQ